MTFKEEGMNDSCIDFEPISDEDLVPVRLGPIADTRTEEGLTKSKLFVDWPEGDGSGGWRPAP
jgi:hypothetical protein